jgi:threonine dehydratase
VAAARAGLAARDGALRRAQVTAPVRRDPPDLLTLTEFEAAREVLRGVVRCTPLEPCRPLAAKLAGPVWLKCENLQRAGSFKVRGAYVRIARLTPRERAAGVVAASAGNHAQGVALAAGLVGAPATVFMPVGAPLPKLAATKGYGARVESVGTSVDESLLAAEEFAERTGAVLVHPFDHRDVIAGQGTVALEIMEQCPEVETIVVAVGGGGLISGIAAAAKAIKPGVRVIGVQAAGAAAYPPSLSAGRPVRLERLGTIADGIAVGRPGDLPFAHVSRLVDEVVTVTDEDISRALLTLMERCKTVVEPAGGVGVAAALTGRVPARTPAVVVLSGGNIDPLLMVRVLEHGLAAAGRYLRLTVYCGDRPGQLAAVLSWIAGHGANVVDVSHNRRDPRLRMGEVAVDLSVETRGSEHADRLVSALREAGYSVSLDGT